MIAEGHADGVSSNRDWDQKPEQDAHWNSGLGYCLMHDRMKYLKGPENIIVWVGKKADENNDHVASLFSSSTNADLMLYCTTHCHVYDSRRLGKEEPQSLIRDCRCCPLRGRGIFHTRSDHSSLWARLGISNAVGGLDGHIDGHIVNKVYINSRSINASRNRNLYEALTRLTHGIHPNVGHILQ